MTSPPRRYLYRTANRFASKTLHAHTQPPMPTPNLWDAGCGSPPASRIYFLRRFFDYPITPHCDTPWPNSGLVRHASRPQLHQGAPSPSAAREESSETFLHQPLRPRPLLPPPFLQVLHGAGMGRAALHDHISAEMGGAHAATGLSLTTRRPCTFLKARLSHAAQRRSDLAQKAHRNLAHPNSFSLSHATSPRPALGTRFAASAASRAGKY